MNNNNNFTYIIIHRMSIHTIPYAFVYILTYLFMHSTWAGKVYQSNFDYNSTEGMGRLVSRSLVLCGVVIPRNL